MSFSINAKEGDDPRAQNAPLFRRATDVWRCRPTNIARDGLLHARELRSTSRVSGAVAEQSEDAIGVGV